MIFNKIIPENNYRELDFELFALEKFKSIFFFFNE